ncbi:MAG: hypothetical protein ACYSSI_02355 [Planctomycetota bacterium]
MMFWLWCSENSQVKDGETGFCIALPCSPDAELRICSSQNHQQANLNCSMAIL